MDRNIVYPGAIPLDTDLLTANKDVMMAIGALLAATLGSGPVIDGLQVAPSVPASMAVTVAAGSLTTTSVADQAAYGSLPADATPLVKMGVNPLPTSFTLAAPATAGQSVIYLIQAAFGETDDAAAVLPYFNAANPAVPYLGPANAGTAQPTRRRQFVQLQLKAGAAATTGTQTAPPVDAGWTGLATITVNAGQTTITSAAITALPSGAPLAYKLPNLKPGFTALASFTTSGTFTVPPGITTVKVTVTGGGGAGGTHSSQPSGGGGAGGRAIKIITGLTPGSTIAVTVGSGGAASASPASGGSGGTSAFGAYVSATGGAGGIGGTGGAVNAGAAGGIGINGDVNSAGAYGTDAIPSTGRGGDGGGPGNGRGSTGTVTAISAPGYGGGGGGGGTAAMGGAGGPGHVMIEY